MFTIYIISNFLAVNHSWRFYKITLLYSAVHSQYIFMYICRYSCTHNVHGYMHYSSTYTVQGYMKYHSTENCVYLFQIIQPCTVYNIHVHCTAINSKQYITILILTEIISPAACNQCKVTKHEQTISLLSILGVKVNICIQSAETFLSVH